MTAIYPLVGALALGLGVYWLLDAVHIGPTASKYLKDFKGERPPDFTDRLGAWLSQHLPLPVRLADWDLLIRWAQRNGDLQHMTAVRLLGQVALYLALGFGTLLVMKPKAPLFWLPPLLLGAYPLLQVRNRANRAMKAAVRALPEVASLAAAEMAAGNSAEQALARAADLTGPLGRFLAEAQDYARQTGRPLFSQPPITGALVEFVRREAGEVRALNTFASQLDMVARKGVSGPQLMNEIARTLAREHRQEVMRLAKSLDSKLVVATAIFYFMPFVGLLLVAFAAPVLQVLSAAGR